MRVRRPGCHSEAAAGDPEESRAWAFSPDQDLPAVGFDNRVAMAELAGKVIEMGHRRIAYISGTIAGNDRAKSRYDGVQDAMFAAGLDPKDLPMIALASGVFILIH